ncbi:MAG: sigma factor, partial [Dyadobacter sp.]
MRNPQLDNEEDLLLLASKSDAAAFTTIFHHYKHKLYSYVFRLTKSGQLTEDIIQDVFMKLWNDHALLADVDNFGGYLFRMSKNHVVNHFKRMAHETLIMAEFFHHLPTEHNDIQEIIAVNEVQKLL